MSGIQKLALTMMALMVVAMIVRDPHQAHRPPEFRSSLIVQSAGLIAI